MDINELYQELIIDHGTQPRNFKAMPDPTLFTEGHNPLCGDKICLSLMLENKCIKEVCFQGQGCAISMASASLMTELLPGKSLNEALTLAEMLQHHLTHSEAPTDTKVSEASLPTEVNELGKLTALSGVRAFPARVKCATLAWHTLQSALGSAPNDNDTSK